MDVRKTGTSGAKKKNALLLILGIAGIVLVVWGIYLTLNPGAAAAAASISVIGKADGPTSIFIASKPGIGPRIGILVVGLICILSSMLLYICRKKKK